MSQGPGKVRKTITLDPDVIEVLGADDAALSATINEILRAEVDRRQRAAALAKLLARLEDERGPVDPDEVADFRRLLR
jgi:hypothetical protein